MLINILAFLFVLGVLVFVHELGHFTMARFFGVKVEEFAFGFPPRLWSKKKGDTEYAINWIPFGGYVRMYGEEGGHSKDPKSFTAKKSWQKCIILAAGVAMNLLLAWAIFTGFYLFGGKAIIAGMDQHPWVDNTQRVYVTDVVKDSPAAQNGISSGDVIISVNGKEVRDNASVFVGVQDAKRQNPDKPVTVVIIKDGQQKAVQVDTYKEKVQDQSGSTEVERIGISMEEKGVVRAKWYAAPLVGLLETGRVIKLTLQGLWDLLVNIFTRFKVGNAVGGPVAIYSMSGVAARLGFWALMQFVAILSVSLALINILPFPALDGGHIFIILIETLRGKKIPDRTKQTINMVGFGLLLLLMVGLVFKDLATFDIYSKIKGIFK